MTCVIYPNRYKCQNFVKFTEKTCVMGFILNYFTKEQGRNIINYSSRYFKFTILWQIPVARRCYVRKVFLKFSQNSQKNTCAGASFSFKLACIQSKKNTLTRVLSYEFCEIYKKTYFVCRTSANGCFCRYILCRSTLLCPRKSQQIRLISQTLFFLSTK